jgi:hypothetical protein
MPDIVQQYKYMVAAYRLMSVKARTLEQLVSQRTSAGGEPWIRVLVCKRTVRPAEGQPQQQEERGASFIMSMCGCGALDGLSLAWKAWMMRKSEGPKCGSGGELPSGIPDKRTRG